MKHILLLGDSIRMGYDHAVKKTLDGIAEVYFPSDNCRFASYLLRYVHEYKELLNGQDADVVHWNAGLWDCLRLFGEDPHTPVDVYRYYIDRICARMNTLFPHAKIIFATSTSVLSEKMPPDFKRYNNEIEVYNQAAVEIVSRYGFCVNDLYSLSTALPPEAHYPDGVHYYSSMGTEAITNQVLRHLAQALALETVPTYKEALYTDKPIGI